MPYNSLNALIEIKHVQEMTQEILNKEPYINYKNIWKRLCRENKFFKSYHTYLKYINETCINERINKLLFENK